jgi:hypothetical protein
MFAFAFAFRARLLAAGCWLLAAGCGWLNPRIHTMVEIFFYTYRVWGV